MPVQTDVLLRFGLVTGKQAKITQHGSGKEKKQTKITQHGVGRTRSRLSMGVGRTRSRLR